MEAHVKYLLLKAELDMLVDLRDSLQARIENVNNQINELVPEKLNEGIRESGESFFEKFKQVDMNYEIAEASKKVVDDILFKNDTERT